MQDLTFRFLIDIGIIAFFVALFVLFVYQSIKKQRKAYVLTFGLIMGASGALFSTFSTLISDLGHSSTDSVLAGRFLTSMFGFIVLAGSLVMTIIIWQMKQTKVISPELEYIAFGGILIGIGFTLFGVLVGGNTSGSFYLTVISITVYSVSFLFIYAFFEQLEQEKPERIRMLIIACLFLAICFTGWLTLFDLSSIPGEFGKVAIVMWDFAYDSFGVVIFIFGAYVHYKAYNYTRERNLFILTIGATLIAIGFVIGFLNDIKSDFLFLNEIFSLLGDLGGVLGDFVKLLGMAIFFIVYILNIDYLYRIPVNIYAIMFFSSAGLSLYSAKVESPIEIDDSFISAVIVAISEFIKQVIGTRGTLERIITQDRTFVFSSGENISAAIFADRSTYFLSNSLRFATAELDKSLGEKFDPGSYDLDEIAPKVEEIFLKHFPYIKLVI
ncbi:MAG: hypothetical protein ACFFBD_03005 [Candidatus Hodarchaeota archaeon]